jgi:Rap1a immunity proteins
MSGITGVVVISAVIFCGTLGQVRAAEGSNKVSALVEECKTDQRDCEEYLLGVWDSAIMLQDLNRYSTVVFCPTSGPTGEQLRLAFNKWATDADPQVLRDSPRVVGAILSGKHAFPCKPKAE